MENKRQDAYKGGCGVILLIAVISAINTYMLNSGIEKTLYFSLFSTTWLTNYGLYHYNGSEREMYLYGFAAMIIVAFVLFYLIARRHRSGLWLAFLAFMADTGFMIYFALTQSDYRLWAVEFIVHGIILLIWLYCLLVSRKTCRVIENSKEKEYHNVSEDISRLEGFYDVDDE